MTSLRVSVSLAALGVSSIIGGVVLLAGLAWGLIIGGVMGLVAAFLLYDPPPAGNRPDPAKVALTERGKPR